jgi:hypothetical protein
MDRGTAPLREGHCLGLNIMNLTDCEPNLESSHRVYYTPPAGTQVTETELVEPRQQ